VTEVGLGAGQVPRRFERHVSPGRQVELGTGSVDGTIGGELHGHTFSSVRLEQRPYGNPVLEAGPGAIFDPTLRTPESKLHVTVRARTPCRLAVLRRDRLDSEALLGVAAQQTARLEERRPRI